MTKWIPKSRPRQRSKKNYTNYPAGRRDGASNNAHKRDPNLEFTVYNSSSGLS